MYQLARSRLIDGFLIATSLVAIPLVVVGIDTILTFGLQLTVVLGIIFVVILWGITLLRHALPLTLRAMFIIGMPMIIGISGLWSYGLMATTPAFMIFATVISALVFGLRGGIISLGVSILILVVAGTYTVSQKHLPDLDMADYMVSPHAWFTFAGLTCFIAGALAIAVGVFNRNFLNLLEEQRLHSQHVAEELQIAQNTQRKMLPTNTDIAVARQHFGLEIDHHFEPSTELGGDIWGMRELDNGRLAIYMADFTGHGVSAAMNTMRLHTLVDRIGEGDAGSSGTVLSYLNIILAELLPRGQFATMLYGVIDPKNNTFKYSSAGAPDLILGGERHEEDLAVTKVEWNSLPLGVDRDFIYPTREVTIPDGGFLFLHSDALMEMPNHVGSILEGKGVIRLVEKSVKNAAYANPLHAVIQNFRGEKPQPLGDDLTMVWVKFAG